MSDILEDISSLALARAIEANSAEEVALAFKIIAQYNIISGGLISE